MNSLRTRLIAALLCMMLLFWASWFAVLAMEMGRQQTGVWDEELRDMAGIVLLSLPSDLNVRPDSPTYRIQGDSPARRMSKTFQLWSLKPREMLLRSLKAPATPMNADFHEGFNDVEIDGKPWRVYGMQDAAGTVQVQTGQPLAERAAQFHLWLWSSLAAGGLLFVLLGFTIAFAVNRALRRIDAVRMAMQQRDPFDLRPLPQAGVPREIAPLIVSVNGLFERLEMALSRERHFIADAAHELRTPLAALITQTELAAGAGDAAQKQTALDKLLAIARRTARLSEQLLDQARLEAPDCAMLSGVDLGGAVAMVVRDYEIQARRKKQRIMLDVQPCDIRGNLDALGVLVRNLVDNALRYTPEEGSVSVSCRHEGAGVVLRVADDGPGVPVHERERIFDRFYRIAGNSERGSGIGLALVARIARQHGAQVACAAGLAGRGLEIALVFAQGDADAAPAGSDMSSMPASDCCIEQSGMDAMRAGGR